MSIILGFDISTSTIGWCAIEINDGKMYYLECDYIKPPKKGTIFERLAKTKEEILQVIHTYQPDYVGIEDIVKFMKGHSTAKTIISLASINRMVGLTVHEHCKNSPELFSVLQIRHGIRRMSGLKKLPPKEDIPELTAKILGMNSFMWRYKKTGKPMIENYDMADAMACAIYCASLHLETNNAT